MPILEGSAVSKRFGGLAAVAGVDFGVEQGAVVGLIGPNGAGKTTLFNLISGALVPETGKIRFQGQDITGLKPHRICRSGIARTFQAVRIFPHLPVEENVRVAARFGRGTKVSAGEVDRQTSELLSFVGLAGQRTVAARDLTLPQQKRLEVARALATAPRLLLLDELMAGLNPTEVAETMALVRRLHDQGLTLFLIEHVMKAIMEVCDRIIVLHHGQKIAEGTPQEIATSRTVVEVYLGE